MGFLDKIFGAIGEWSRKRDERERDFVAANAGWGSAAAPTPAAKNRPGVAIDREGLQAAFLDVSGKIAYYLDTESGDVVESREAASHSLPRFRRVPSRPANADDEDRRAFVRMLDPSPARDKLAAARDAAEFRGALAADREIERRWYVFRNDRARAAVEEWLKREGV